MPPPHIAIMRPPRQTPPWCQLIDLMVDEENVRAFVGVTLLVQIIAGLLLVPAMLLALWGLVGLTCLWRRTVREAQEENEAHDVLKARSLVATVFNFVMFVFSPASSHFFVVMFLLEAKESIVQALAVEQMSRAGIGREALTIYTCVILLNGLAPLASAWVVRHINRVDQEDVLRRRAEASKWTARLLLFDAFGDLLYSFFALAHLLVRVGLLFGATSPDTEEARVAEFYASHSYVRDGNLKVGLHVQALGELRLGFASSSAASCFTFLQPYSRASSSSSSSSSFSFNASFAFFASPSPSPFEGSNADVRGRKFALWRKKRPGCLDQAPQSRAAAPA